MSRRTVIGLLICVVLAVGALGAGTAAAAGTTAYRCSNTGSGSFSDAHCTQASEAGSFAHVAITSNSLWAYGGIGTEASTLTTTISGVELEIRCTEASVLGEAENFELGGEMRVRGAVMFTYKGCTVQKPSEKGCKVHGGEITVGESTIGWVGKMELTTQGTGMGVKFVEGEGGPLASIQIEGCAITPLNRTYSLTGSFTATPSGATMTTTHEAVTSQGTLKLAGQTAGLATKLTLNKLGTPLAFTT